MAEFTGDPRECAQCRDCGQPMLGIYKDGLRYYCYFCGDEEDDPVPPPVKPKPAA